MTFIEITYYNNSLERAADGNFLNVPLLAGTTKNEHDVFTLASEIVSSGKVIPTLEEIISDINTVVSKVSKSITLHLLSTSGDLGVSNSHGNDISCKGRT